MVEFEAEREGAVFQVVRVMSLTGVCSQCPEGRERALCHKTCSHPTRPFLPREHRVQQVGAGQGRAAWVPATGRAANCLFVVLKETSQYRGSEGCGNLEHRLFQMRQHLGGLLTCKRNRG